MLCANCDKGITIPSEATYCSVCKAVIHNDCMQKCHKCGDTLCDKCAIKYEWKCKTCSNIVKHEMEFISSTMFESFEKCPWLFKHEFILKTCDEIKDNKYSVTGSFLHNLFQKYSKIKPETIDDIIVEWNEKYTNEIDIKFFDNECDYETNRIIHEQTIKNWFEEEQNKPLPLFTEEEVFVELSDKLPKIRCTFDRINGSLDNPSELELEDYKTGKVYTADKLANNMQLPIYAMALKHLYGASPKRLKLYFPQHQQYRIFERSDNDDDVYICYVKRGGVYTLSLNNTLQKMCDIYTNIKQGVFIPNTKNTYFCDNFCPLGKNNMCDGISTKWSIQNKIYKR